jgi:hypothetical protein
VRQRVLIVFLLGCGLLSLAVVLACNGKGTQGSRFAGGTITLNVSDPATCGGANGPFSHIFVTISRVQLSPDANAAPGDPSFVDLGNGLKQVDLLGTPNQCSLATLGSNLNLPPGGYAQVRVFLAADGTSIPGNQCGLAANCVTLSGDPLNTPHAIQLGAETTQGIAIAGNQLAGGSFIAVADQAQTLNLNFDACASVVSLGGNQFRFKPVLLAGDTGTAPGATPNAISGKVVDSVSQVPIPNAEVIAALEQVDSGGVDRVVMQTLADAQGNFTFCPVPPGTYDVVTSAVGASGAGFAATVTFGIHPGNNLGQVPMIAVQGSPNTPAFLSGTVNTSTGFGQPTSADLSVSALQAISSGGVTAATIPSLNLPSSTSTIASQSSASCPPNADCNTYNLEVPPTNPNVGTFSSNGTTYTQGGGTVTYNVETRAFVPLSGSAPDCSPSSQSFGPVTVSPGVTAVIPPQVFGACQ